jgi:hypothetical protein
LADSSAGHTQQVDEREPPPRNMSEEPRIGAVPYDETPWGRFVARSGRYKTAFLVQAVCVMVLPAIVFLHSWPAFATATVVGGLAVAWFQWVERHEPQPRLNQSDTRDHI